MGAAEAEEDETGEHGQYRRADPGGEHAEREAGEVLRMREHDVRRARTGCVHRHVIIQPDLHDRADVHPGPEENDVAERVVTHLAAEHVPGRGEHDHQPHDRDLVGVLRQEKRRDQAENRDADESERVAVHCTACRKRSNCRMPNVSTPRHRMTSNACWNPAPTRNPPNCPNTPMPKPEAITPGRLLTPAAVTITNRRME